MMLQDIATFVNSRSSFNYRGHRKVLFVDDEPHMTSLFKRLTEPIGFTVDVFNDATQTLKNFKPCFYDLVILDIVMPKMNGYDLYKELKKRDPHVNVCFITASEEYCEDLRKEEYRALNKDLFLRKPMPMKSLLAEINKRIK